MNFDSKIAGGNGLRVRRHLLKISDHFCEGTVEIANLVRGVGGRISDGKVAGGNLASMGDQERHAQGQAAAG
jgi:hypothetical protein